MWARDLSSASTAAAKSSGGTSATLWRSALAARASSGFQGSEPLLNSANAARELAQAVAALARCSGSGRGPSRLRPAAPISCSRRPIHRRQLADHAGKDAGAIRICCHGDQLILPQVDIPLGKARKVLRGRPEDRVYRRRRVKTSAGPAHSAFQHPLVKAVMLNNSPAHRAWRLEGIDMNDKVAAQTPPAVIKKTANRRVSKPAATSYG